MAKTCIQLPGQIRFKTGKRLRTETNGAPYRIIVTYRKGIKHWPLIKSGDAHAY